MDERIELHVNIGEVKVGRSKEVLKATLGSCVGIAFYWPEKQMAGLAHCLLPESPLPTTQIGAKYVSQAVPSLMALMKIKQENISEILVYIAGGGNMMEQLARSNPRHVGIQNSDAAKAILSKLGFKIKEIEVGGDQGRQILISSESGKVDVLKFVKSA